MTGIEDLAATLASLGDAFEAVGATWAVGGSLASTAYGEPRATNDIDVIATLDEAGARNLGRTLGDDFYCSDDAAIDAVQRHSSFNVIDQRSFLKVDVFVPGPGPLGEGQLGRRRLLVIVGDLEVPVLGPEDIVLQKLRWFRLGGEVSDRQWNDLLSVLRAGDLDEAYLDEVAKSARLDELLERARKDA